LVLELSHGAGFVNASALQALHAEVHEAGRRALGHQAAGDADSCLVALDELQRALVSAFSLIAGVTPFGSPRPEVAADDEAQRTAASVIDRLRFRGQPLRPSR
jgi:hypothetical protein